MDTFLEMCERRGGDDEPAIEIHAVSGFRKSGSVGIGPGVGHGVGAGRFCSTNTAEAGLQSVLASAGCGGGTAGR